MALSAVAGASVLDAEYGAAPELTFASGASNGGYQTRLALERYPELFDGGVDWEGTFFTSAPVNPFVYLPPVLTNYLPYRSTGDQAAYEAIVHQGRMPPDSEPIWDNHNIIYWGATMSAYRPVFDPEYTDYIATARTPVLPGDPDATYDYASRPAFVAERLDQVAVTGEINGKPLLTLHGTLDALLPISTASDPYTEAVRASGNAPNHRYYVIEGATHVDALADDHPDGFRPLLPCYVEALDALDAWVSDGVAPPPSGFIPFPAEDTPTERANSCPLPAAVQRVAGPDRIATAIAGSRGAVGIAETVVIAAAGDFPDALSAAPLAAALEAPLLLVGDEVTNILATELHRTGALEAVVVGGPAAVADWVIDELEALGLDVRRVAGPDRFATAAAVAGEIGGDGTAYIASGRSFADALAIAPVAAREGRPILLVEPGSIPSATAGALSEVSRTIVVGGTAAVSEGVVEGLPSATRIAGEDRYATAAAVVDRALEEGRVDQIAVADGRGFADALAAAPVLAAGYGGAAPGGLLLLVDGAGPGLPTATADVLRTNAGAFDQILVFGGPAAVSDSVVATL